MASPPGQQIEVDSIFPLTSPTRGPYTTKLYHSILEASPSTPWSTCCGSCTHQSFSQISQLLMPHHEWLRFNISPIGTTLRPEEPERGLTPDMVIPIAPNIAHGQEGRLIESETPFPFTSCFHWFGNNITVRIKVLFKDQYDHTHGVRVSSFEHVRLKKIFESDRRRFLAFNDRKREAARSPTRDSSASPRAKSRSTSTSSSGSSSFRASSPPGSGADGQGSSAPSVASSADYATATIEPVFTEDFFGVDPVPGESLFPILDCWLDLEEHLTEDTIPSPVLFFEEVRVIKS